MPESTNPLSSQAIVENHTKFRDPGYQFVQGYFFCHMAAIHKGGGGCVQLFFRYCALQRGGPPGHSCMWAGSKSKIQPFYVLSCAIATGWPFFQKKKSWVLGVPNSVSKGKLGFFRGQHPILVHNQHFQAKNTLCDP